MRVGSDVNKFNPPAFRPCVWADGRIKNQNPKPQFKMQNAGPSRFFAIRLFRPVSVDDSGDLFCNTLSTCDLASMVYILSAVQVD